MVTAVLLGGALTSVVSSSPAAAADAPSTTAAPTTIVAAAAATTPDSQAVLIDSTTTTTEATTTTSEAPTTSTTVPQVEVQGSSTYNTDCHNTLLGPDAPPDNLVFHVTASALSPVETGQNLTIMNQHWNVTVPASTADTLRGLGVTTNLATSTTVTVTGANVSPGSITSAPITASIDFSGAMGTDATGSFNVPDMVFIPTGGTATFTLNVGLGISTTLDLPLGDPPPTPVTITCLPTSGAEFLSVDVYGTPLPSTTTTTTGKAKPAAAVTTTLPLTGPNNHTLWIEVLAGLLMVQLGLLLVAFSRKARLTKTS